ncbi:Las1-like-domain-containing protein [Lipomyces kononenkoae]|uniref:Las1-like-domain-containing protein n=1 Tax=Lipomyces kononenkoae TaxID=34357 RepID=A0ACC3TAK0_LIPKO
MSRNPRSIPYRDSAELEQLYTWFFDSAQDRKKAISLVKAYTTRGHVPYGIECTAIVVSSILLDSTSTAQENIMAIRLSYSSSIIRFVNGFLDPHQTTQFALPLHTLAQKIGMPTMFVELRHACTHESLPSLEVLRHAAIQALEWLKDRYWKPELERLRDAQNCSPKRVLECIENWINMFGKGNDDEESEGDTDDDLALEVIRSDFEGIRYQAKDSSSLGRAYWRALKLLAQLSEQEYEVFNTVGVDLIFSHGFRKGVTSLKSLKIFSPLLQYIAPPVTEALLKRCLEEIVNKPTWQSGFPVFRPSDDAIIYLGRDKTEDPAVSHGRNWVRHILSHPCPALDHADGTKDKSIRGFSISYENFVKLCLRLSPPTPTVFDLLKLAKKHLAVRPDDPIHELLETYGNQVEILYSDGANRSVQQNKRRRNDTDELSATIENIEKRADKIGQYQKKVKLAAAATHSPAKVVRSWTLLEGPWCSRPIGEL